jgi:hypothetical protein
LGEQGDEKQDDKEYMFGIGHDAPQDQIGMMAQGTSLSDLLT